MTMLFRSLPIILVLAFFSGVLPAQDIPSSKLQPAQEYRATIKKTLAGNDGFREIIPSTSVQTVVLVTEEGSTDGFMATLSVQRARSADDRSAGADMDWRFRFLVTPSGTLERIEVLDAQETLNEKLAYALLSRELAALLFATEYRLKDGTLPRITISGLGESGGDVSFDYAVAPKEENGASGQPIASVITGKATFSSAHGVYTHRTLKQEDRIYVAQDAIGDEKEVIMRREVITEISVSPAK